MKSDEIYIRLLENTIASRLTDRPFHIPPSATVVGNAFESTSETSPLSFFLSFFHPRPGLSFRAISLSTMNLSASRVLSDRPSPLLEPRRPRRENHDEKGGREGWLTTPRREIVPLPICFSQSSRNVIQPGTSPKDNSRE